MLIGLDSCKKDDDVVSDPIVGTWKLAIQGDWGNGFYGYWYCIFKFNGDGTMGVKSWEEQMVEPKEWYPGTWKINGDNIYLMPEGEDTEIYKFNLEGNKLIIYDYEVSGPNVFVRQ